MTRLGYWIQRADFTTTDGYVNAVEEAIQVFSSHDWEAQWARAQQIEANGDEACPPGIGYHPDVPDTDRLLHICPTAWDTAFVLYQYVGSMKRLFGLLPPAAVVTDTACSGFPTEHVAEAIRLFASQKHDDLMALLARHQRA